VNKNAKIALGCGGAGCLGLIVLGIIGGAVYFYMAKAPSRNYNFNVNTNTNVNSNTNTNRNTNRNSNQNSSNTSNSSTSGMSDDAKHKLFQAAAITADADLVRRVNVKIGILNDDFTLGDDYAEFVTSHAAWAIQNSDFVVEMSTAEKGRAYVVEHMDD
jgi:hypothetical protein